MRKPNWARRLLVDYGFALLSVAVALFFSLMFTSLLAEYPFLLFFGAVILSAWYGGFGPGLLTSVLSILAVNYFFLYPAHVENIGRSDLVRFILSVIVVVVLGFIRRRHNQTMEALRQSRDQLELYLKDMANGVLVQDRNGKLIYANYEAAKLMGFSSAQVLLNTPSSEVLTRFDLFDEFGEPFPLGSLPTRLALLGMKYPEAVIRYRFKDTGEERWSYVKARPIFNEQGELQQAVSLLLDITELKAAQQSEREQRILAEALRDTAEALSSTLELAQVLDRILENVERVMPHDAADIMLIDGDAAHVARYRGYEEYVMTDMLLNLKFPLETTPTLKQMISTGQPLVVPDTQVYPGWLNIPKMEWLRSYISVPLISEGKPRGFLNLSSVTPDHFTRQDTSRLQPFAAQATVAIRNAQLYSEARRQAGDNTIAS